MSPAGSDTDETVPDTTGETAASEGNAAGASGSGSPSKPAAVDVPSLTRTGVSTASLEQASKAYQFNETLRPRHLLVRDNSDNSKQERELVRQQMAALRDHRQRQLKEMKQLLARQQAELDSLDAKHAKEKAADRSDADLALLRKEHTDRIAMVRKRHGVERKKLNDSLKDFAKQQKKDFRSTLKVRSKTVTQEIKQTASSAKVKERNRTSHM